jgi:ferritin-like metal-binding protein YciE
MKIETLEQFFADELFDVFDAETRMTKALPKMAKAATDKNLIKGFENHLSETLGQIERLEKVFAICGIKKKKETCDAMKGLVEEGDELMKNVKDPQVLDAALIAAAQKVEHYEIATYGTLVALAETLGHTEAAALLKKTLDEEKRTDEKLTKLAEGNINEDALRQAA